MKPLFLHSITFIMLLGFAFSMQAQVTITAESFQREAIFVDSFYSDRSAGLMVPAEGPDQVWDYSELALDNFSILNYIDASGDPVFTDALNYWRDDLSFLGLPIENYDYEAIDEMGWNEVGRRIVETAFPIAMLTGGVNDTIRFLDTAYVYDNRIDLLQFPLTYEDQWTQSRNEFTTFEISIQAFGLNKALGKSSSTHIDNREIVGYGSVVLPALDGTPTPPIEVLLLKTVVTHIDSVFLNGAPAPPALLQPFGLTQGERREDVRYLMYRPGFPSPVMNIGVSAENEVTFAAFRPHVLETITSVKDVNLLPTSHFPNPVAAGQVLTIETPEEMTASFFRLIDAQGRVVQQQQIVDASSKNSLQIRMADNLPQGIYFYEISDPKGDFKGRGIVHIQ